MMYQNIFALSISFKFEFYILKIHKSQGDFLVFKILEN